MDPYRPPPFGYPSPAGQFGPRPPFMRPPPNFQYPPPHAFQPGRPPPPPMAAQARPVGMSDNEDKQRTMFVGAIPGGITDEWLERMLKACGSLKEWKRLKDASGKPKGFGFATYDDFDSVLRALRILSKSNTNPGITLKAQDGTDVEKTLIVKVDDNVRQVLDMYEKTHKEENRSALDEKAVSYVAQIIHSLMGPQEDKLNKGLAMLRERAGAKVDDSRNIPQSENGDAGLDDSKRARHERQRFVRDSENKSDSVADDETDDEEIEKRRKERHDREAESRYRKKVDEYERFERTRLTEYEHDLEKEQDKAQLLEARKEKIAKWLAEYDDDQMKEEDDFYVDSSRWKRKRRRMRRDEERADERDRQLEKEEREEARHREDEERQQKEELAKKQLHKDKGQKIAMKPTKFNMNLPIKRIGNLGGEEDDDEENGKKRRILVPLDYGDVEEETKDVVPLTPEEREKRIKELIGSIPSSENELWSWSVKWDQLSDTLIQEKIRPFIQKKIKELVGMEEDEMVEFILEFVRDQKPPKDLVEELETLLDKDALIFVMKLWRCLIFETERSFQAL